MTQSESFGIWQLIPSSLLTSVLLSRDLDFVIIDFEHGAFEVSTLIQCVFAAKALNKKVYARVPSHLSQLIPQILDANVDGILYAHIDNLHDACDAARTLRFPPDGERSFTPFSYAFLYNSPSRTTPSPKLGLLLESIEGVNAFDEMVESTKIDFVYFGAYDLSAELGKPGDIFSPEVLQLLKCLASKCSLHNIPLWSLGTNHDDIALLKTIGVNAIVYGVDTGVISNAVSTLDLK